jgi:hypothetical protein
LTIRANRGRHLPAGHRPVSEDIGDVKLRRCVERARDAHSKRQVPQHQRRLNPILIEAFVPTIVASGSQGPKTIAAVCVNDGSSFGLIEQRMSIAASNMAIAVHNAVSP